MRTLVVALVLAGCEGGESGTEDTQPQPGDTFEVLDTEMAPLPSPCDEPRVISWPVNVRNLADEAVTVSILSAQSGGWVEDNDAVLTVGAGSTEAVEVRVTIPCDGDSHPLGEHVEALDAHNTRTDEHHAGEVRIVVE